MKKLRVDQKIIVIAYALDLLMPFLISYGTYKPAYEMTKLMYLASQLGIICYGSFMILPIPYAIALVFLKEADLKGNSLAWLTLGIINLAIFHRFNVQSIIEMPTIFICIVLCLLFKYLFIIRIRSLLKNDKINGIEEG